MLKMSHRKSIFLCPQSAECIVELKKSPGNSDTLLGAAKQSDAQKYGAKVSWAL